MRRHLIFLKHCAKSTVKRLIPERFRRLRIHIEPFFKTSFNSVTPGICGWSNKHNLSIYALVNGKKHDAITLSRPDAANSFYVELPSLEETDEVLLNYEYCDKTMNLARFTRRHTSPSTVNEKTLVGSVDPNAVLIHAYYPDIFEEFIVQIAALNQSWDLYVFVPEGSPMHESLTRGCFINTPVTQFLVGPSRGRDASGFISSLNYITSIGKVYNALLVLQTKRSPQFPESVGKSWRELLTNPLLGSQSAVERAMAFFATDQDINLIGSAELVQRYEYGCGSGIHSRFKRLCQIFSVQPQDTDFIAGTMFWIRHSALAIICDTEKLNEVTALLEPGTIEPSYAHAWERFIGLIATRNSGKIQGIEFPSSFEMVLMNNQISKMDRKVP